MKVQETVLLIIQFYHQEYPVSKLCFLFAIAFCLQVSNFFFQ